MDFDKKCINCNVYLRKVLGYKKVTITINEANIATEKIGKKVFITDTFCGECRVTLTRQPILKNSDLSADGVSIESQPISSQSSFTTVSSVSTISSTGDPSYVVIEKMEEELEFVELGSPRNIATHEYCFLKEECLFPKEIGIVETILLKSGSMMKTLTIFEFIRIPAYVKFVIWKNYLVSSLLVLIRL